MILSLTAFACNKPANNSQKESENVSVEQSLQESETQSNPEEECTVRLIIKDYDGNENFIECQNANYEVFISYQLWIEFSDGRYFDGMNLQEYYKIEEGEVVIFAGSGSNYERYDSLESFNSIASGYEIEKITTASGEVVDSISSGVYFVTFAEKE